MSDKRNMLNGSQAVKMEINSKPATNSCDFSQCSSSGTTVAQETGNLKLRSKICDWDRETETEADIISALCIVCFSRSHAHSQLQVLFWFFLMLLPHPCCFEISRICRWDRFRYTGSDGEGNKFPVYAPFVRIACFLPEVFMSFVTNRQGSQIRDFGKLLQGGWLMRNEKPSEKKQTREYYLQNVFLFARQEKERERPEQVSRFGKFAWPEVVALFVPSPWVKGDADDLFEIVPNNRNYNWMSTSNEFPTDL